MNSLAASSQQGTPYQKAKGWLLWHGKTLQWLADELDINPGYLYDILNGYRRAVKVRRQIVERELLPAEIVYPDGRPSHQEAA